MNKELLQKVRDRIADESVHYDQGDYWYSPGEDGFYDTVRDAIKENKFCGTPCCIAGHAIAAAGIDKAYEVRNKDFQEAAEVILDLTPDEAVAMFDATPIFDEGARSGYREPTREEALAMLGRAIETGEVKWEVIVGRPLSASQ